MQNKFLVVDGLSRAGKFLVGKSLLCSKAITSQVYLGYLERLIETIHFQSNLESQDSPYLELLRLFFVHTADDLRRYRLASLDPSDSSFFKNTAFYRSNQLAFDSYNFSALEEDATALFVTHTHESIRFFSNLYSSDIAKQLLNEFTHCFIIPIRNPSSLILSWLNRKYVDSWRNPTFSSFKLFQLNTHVVCLSDIGVSKVPWFVNESLNWLVEDKNFSTEEINLLTKDQIIAISVIYLLNDYMNIFINSKENKNHETNSFKPIFVAHESLHDRPINTYSHLIEKLNLPSFDESQLPYLLDEVKPEIFGWDSISNDFKKCCSILKSQKIINLLNNCSEKYNSLSTSI